tara:strand:+ start:1170 stop:1454 length:285 start_codon:yes stop_codon:yes gene_type:complete
MVGDGYNFVMACEYADHDKTEYAEPDAGPIYCDYEEAETSGSNWQDKMREWSKSKEASEIEARNHDQWVYPYKSVEEASIAMYDQHADYIEDQQ